MKKFIKDLKRYNSYIWYTAWAELKVEIINSYLGWLWLVLEPLAFMFIYMRNNYKSIFTKICIIVN